MENESAPPDSLKTSPPIQTRDPLIRYSVFAALGCAAVCMIFTILYVFCYSLDSTLSFERHFDSYIAPANAASLPTLLGLHMAQNRMFLQSCGIVAGIFFAFLGLALLLVGIHGTLDAHKVEDYSTNIKRLVPGGIILLASMIFVGVSAMHPIEFVLGPTAPGTAISVAPAASPATQSQVQPTPTPATPQAAYLAPQSAQPTPTAVRPPAVQPASHPAQTTPATATAPSPTTRLALVSQKPRTPRPTQHRFQP